MRLYSIPAQYRRGLAVGLVTGVAAFLAQQYAIELPPALQATIIAVLVGGAVEVPPTDR